MGKARESYLAVTMFCAVNCLGIADICNLLKDDVINENNWNRINKKKAPTFRFIIELMPCTKPMMAFDDANRIIFE